MKSKLIIINTSQFGYHTDYFKYCEYLKDTYEIKFICFDGGYEKIEMSGIQVKYVKHTGPKTLRGIRFLLIALWNCWFNKAIFFIHYFEKCWWLKKFSFNRKMILDIRTLSVNPDQTIREKQDLELRKACSIFDHVTVISDGIRQKIGLLENNSHILPLGADIVSTHDKDFDQELNLLYVGTLNGRDISKTIEGLEIFIQQSKHQRITYDIIGDGKEFNDLKKMINDKNMNHFVHLHGRMTPKQVIPFLDKCNVGVSFVPITSYYNFQPVTKTFEYILSGLACIATETIENSKIINEKNGILCSDDADAFANALSDLINHFPKYNSTKIRETLVDFQWSKIVNQNLNPFLKTIE